jgi:DNA-directed RNA polymerase specialized sigma24 family protein
VSGRSSTKDRPGRLGGYEKRQRAYHPLASARSSKAICPNNDLLVEVLNAYPHAFSLVKALRSDLANHAKPDTKSQERSPGLKSPVRTAPRPLRKRLAPKDRQRLIEQYLDGAMQKELATRYGIGLSSVKTVLREAGAKKYSARI